MTTRSQKADYATPGSLVVAGRRLVPVGIAVALIAAGLALSWSGAGDGLALSLTFGAIFGLVLQRARFCFYCSIRECIEEKEPDGVLGILVALAVGMAGYAVVFGAWMPDPATGRLPPDAFIGPVAWSLVLGGLAFGAGMAISGSCLSAHLYRLGEGSPTAPFALAGAFLGFILGLASWNSLYLAMVVDAPTVWLPAHLGYAGWLMASLALLAVVAWPLVFWHSNRRTQTRAGLARLADDRLKPVKVLFIGRWPGWIGGIAVGVLGMVAYLRVAPLGVTAELSARARAVGTDVGLVPGQLLGLDRLRGCISIVADALLSNNGLFILGLVSASFAAAISSGQFTPQRPRMAHVARGLGGGILLGWGATTALGCSVGTLMSGIHAGALSGWVFALSMLAGIVLLRARALSRR
ncbi:hypothetical protein SAMN02745911_1537 [Aureimonas altamirensis DSM 21988]|uniref:Sulphur transport domain-containing protein n=1 Tax=Aureimonas altamirensis DSM 21988 TaxID=1121026 RepID=A0ABY1IEJ0_9HYPH|nr:YeeE/YedE family protein [Aureimonas altamirensis]SHJ05576.1 hypothetical protein SAMN02745911_1537 [Aureimonas altamirensis DSM 21988]